MAPINVTSVEQQGSTPIQSSQAAPIVRFEQVTIEFGDDPALIDLSFALYAGDTTVIMGTAGSGKTVLLKTTIGLIRPDAGHVYLFGQDITKLNENELLGLRRRAGVLFQESAIFDSLTVEENVSYPLVNPPDQRRPESEVQSRVKEALDFVNLGGTAVRYPSELSGGMRRRVGIARALVGDPKIVMFDEPTAGLDPPTARTICELAMKLRDLEDVSSIFVTHEMNNLEYICSEYAVVDEDGKVIFEREGERLCLINSKVMMMREGKVIFSGTDEALRRAEDPYIKRFLRGH